MMLAVTTWPGSQRTRRWRGVDSNFPFPATKSFVKRFPGLTPFQICCPDADVPSLPHLEKRFSHSTQNSGSLSLTIPRSVGFGR